MQKRANYGITYLPINLNADFPLVGGAPYEQTDLPIRVLHFHECLELGLCFEGNGIFVIGDKVLPFSAGDAVFISPSEIHLAQSAPGTSSHWTWIYLDPVQLLGGTQAAVELDISRLSGSDFQNILSAEKHPIINQIIVRLVEEIRRQGENFENMARALIWQLMIEMQRLAPTSNITPTLSKSGYDRLAPALQRLANTHGTAQPMSELAALCNLSEAHFRRLFHATMGRSPRDYAFDLQMRLAASLLRGTSKSVLSISQDTGFESLSSFNRVFRRTFGMAPRDWRNHKQNSNLSGSKRE